MNRVVLTLPATNQNAPESLHGDWFRDGHVTHTGPMRVSPGVFAENLRIPSGNTPHSHLWGSSQAGRMVKPSHVILGSELLSWRGKVTHSREPEDPDFRLQILVTDSQSLALDHQWPEMSLQIGWGLVHHWPP